MLKLLLDTCVWGGAAPFLKSSGFDVIWMGDSPKDPGDEEILKMAYEQERILITLDKDFGELAILKEMPHFGIVRLVDLSAKKQAIICLQVLYMYSKDLLQGAIVTAEETRIRIRR